MTKAVAKKDNTDLAAPDFLKDKMGSARGSEEIGAEDLTIPRLEQVQALSKCAKKNNANHIEGITEGDFYNNVTRENYGTEVTLIPIFFKKEYLVWRDQDLGGGFAGAHATEALAIAEKGEQEHPEEWEVVDTHQQFCILVKENGKLEDIVVSMAKSKAKVSRKWNSLIRINGGDRFTRQYSYKAIEDQNAKGQDFANANVSNKAFVTEEMYNYAESIYELVQSGVATADRSVDIDEDDIAQGGESEY